MNEVEKSDTTYAGAEEEIEPMANAVSIHEADQLFKEGDVEKAIPLYQQIIEQDLETDYHIDGLGSHAQMLGYYEWFVPKWYH